eukprot:2767196-Rhodomonas_salina.2
MRCGAGLPLVLAALLPFMPRRHGPPLPPVSPDSTVCDSGSWEQVLLCILVDGSAAIGESCIARAMLRARTDVPAKLDSPAMRAMLTGRTELCSEHEGADRDAVTRQSDRKSTQTTLRTVTSIPHVVPRCHTT